MLFKRFVHFRDSNLLSSFSAVGKRMNDARSWFVRLKRTGKTMGFYFLLFSCLILTNKLLDFVDRESRLTSQTVQSTFVHSHQIQSIIKLDINT